MWPALPFFQFPKPINGSTRGELMRRSGQPHCWFLTTDHLGEEIMIPRAVTLFHRLDVIRAR